MQQNDRALKEVSFFFALALGLAYLVFWGPLALFKVPTISFVTNITGPVWAIILFIFGGFVPSFVGILLTWIWEGRPGLHQLGQRIIQFKIGWHWYLAIAAIVVLPSAGQLMIIRLIGQTFDYHLFLTQLGSAIPLILLGPLSEELGWRGYALDRLQANWNALVASILVGIGWALWHLPLFFMVGTSQHELHIPFASFLFGIVALSILFTWLHNNTGSSIWTAIFFHWIYTYSSQVIASGVTRSPLYNSLEYVPYILTAMIVVIVWRSKTLRRKIATLGGEL